MGGKQKQAQRVKNNARPSNSGRSAEFLGTTMPPFSFNAMKETGFTTAAFSLKPMDDIDSSVDTNFQLVLKKMNKKDSTTKLKALQEFTDLLKNTEAEAVKAILPFWPRLYCALVTDAEHRVREATHIAHNQVVLKAKRNLAPYLKQLAGAWFTSQYDTYAPASSAASIAFKNAFPVNKAQEAIVFCQEEILNYIYDNLIVHTANTLSNPQTTSADEAKARYERVLISSLQGYSLYVQQVPEASIKRVEDLNKKIISNNKFWKLARSDIPLVRGSWYKFLTELCGKACFLLKNEENNVVKAVFGNLDENDPTVQAYLWESALLTTTKIEEWWKYYNVETKLYPKLWKVLKEAGNGNATEIYPNLLPLISNLPGTLNNKEFLLTFFRNIKIGLNQNCARASQSESRAIISAFIECLQYSIMKNHLDAELCEQLIKEHLILLLDDTLIDSKASHKAIFMQISSLVQYWHKNKESEYVNYVKYLSLFWQELQQIFESRINQYTKEEKPAVVLDLCTRQIDLMVCLKHSVKVKQLKVKFTTEDDLNKPSQSRASKTQLNVDQSYLESLNHFVYNMCIFYIKIVDNDSAQKLPDMIENIVTLMQEFETSTLIKHLQEEFCKEPKDTETLIPLFEMIFKWIENQLLCRKSLIDFTFLLLKYASDNEMQQVLDKFIMIANEEALGWCITRALQHPHNNLKVVQAWLRNENIGKFLVKIAVYEIEDRSTTDFSLLLKQAFTETLNGELLISKSAIEKIIKLLSNCLLHYSKHTNTIDNCASLASYIASSIYTESSSYNDELFLALFHLSCSTKESEDYEYLSKDTLWEVKTAWQDALTIISSMEDNSILFELSKQCANILESYMFDYSDSFENTAEIISKYLLVIHGNQPLVVGQIVQVFFERGFINSWKSSIYNLRYQAEYMQGNLCLLTTNEYLKNASLNDNILMRYFTWKLLLIKIISTEIPNDEEDNNEAMSKNSFSRLLDDLNVEDQEDEDNNKAKSKNYILKLLHDSNECFLELLQDLVVFDSLVSHYTHQKYYSKMQELHNIFTYKFSEYQFRNLDVSIDTALDSAFSQNRVWAISVYKYYVDMKTQCPTKEYQRLTKLINNQTESRLNLIQAFCQAAEITYEHIDQNVQSSEAIVTLRCLLHCDELDVQIAEVFGCIDVLKKDPNFYNLNFDNWENVQNVIEIARLCTQMLKLKKAENMTKRYWDFIIISLASWCENLNEAQNFTNNFQIATFITSISDLYIAVDQYISNLRIESPNNPWIDEWENVFVKGITVELVRTWLYIAEEFHAMKTIPIGMQLFLQKFGNVISHIQAQYVFDCRINRMPKWSKLLKQCCNLLTNAEHVLQLWGYHMLKVLAVGLIQVDAIAVDTNTPHEKGLIFEQFKDLLVETHNIVSTMLQDFKLGEDSCRVEPFTDSYTYTFAYLLLWDFLLHLCEKSSTELRYQYSDWLRKEDLLSSLLSSIFKLMPLGAFDECSKSYLDYWFVEKSTLSLTEPITCEKIERLNCSVYTSTLSQLPATVRQWWTNVETRTSQLVERVTSAYVSSHLCYQELVNVTAHENKFKNLIIKVHLSVREVVAVYTVDDAQMELIVTLPMNYPLLGPDVQCNRQIGGLPHKQWLMQLRMCLLHQNGRIWDALSLWNNNLNKKFDGVEECYICFAVLHPGTYQLPKLSCKTCKKKFHAACLYKWFSTSNKSTCPICRNLF